MKVNGTNVLAVFEMIEVQHYFRFVAEGFTFFLLISVSYAQGKQCRESISQTISNGCVTYKKNILLTLDFASDSSRCN